MSIAVVTATHNRRHLLERCIQSVREQTRLPDEIIVVDNGSTDGTREWLEAQPDLVVIHQLNSGAAGGFRSGLQLALQRDHDWVWCRDDDCLADRMALAELIDTGCHLTGVAVLNSLSVAPDGQSLVSWVGDLQGRRVWTLQQLRSYRADELVYGGTFWNGPLFPKAVLRLVGMPREEFFTWGEEIEYAARIGQNGIPIRLVPTSVVYHPSQPYLARPFLGRRVRDMASSSAPRYYWFVRNFLQIYDEYPGPYSSSRTVNKVQFVVREMAKLLLLHGPNPILWRAFLMAICDWVKRTRTPPEVVLRKLGPP